MKIVLDLAIPSWLYVYNHQSKDWFLWLSEDMTYTGIKEIRGEENHFVSHIS